VVKEPVVKAPVVEPAVIKCVVWDIDNTLLDGVYLESPEQPPAADPELAAVLRELSGRGILHALASRNPPEAAGYVQAATGVQFAAARCGWDSKAASVRAIAAELDLTTDTLAFVDDDMIERAEVAAALPEVLVLTPEDAVQAPQWPGFSPPVVTAEGRRRAEMYAARQRRQAEAEAFGGSREDFLRQAGTRATIRQASAADLPRLHELSVRTRQLNSGDIALSQDDLAAFVSSAAHLVAVVTLRDSYGDDGVVGCAVLARNGQGSWPVPALMMSCRALGRGVLDALLGWLCRAAAAAGATGLTVPCLVTDRNVPLRLALAAAGLRAAPGSATAGQRAEFTRSLDGSLPPVPEWLTGWDGTP
jgi:methoxymalonate biosynthesis protein